MQKGIYNQLNNKSYVSTQDRKNEISSSSADNSTKGGVSLSPPPFQFKKEDKVEPEHDASAFKKGKQKKIKKAFDTAHIMVTKAIPKIKKDNSHYKKYIDAGKTDTGNTDARVSHVKSGFEKIKTHLEEEKTTMKKWDLPPTHKFKESNTAAYVKSTEKAANIYLGGAFWIIRNKGFDSKAGTIIHELSHKLHGTKDHGYGVANSKKFAISDPQKGSTNADSYEHFAEGA